MDVRSVFQALGQAAHRGSLSLGDLPEGFALPPDFNVAPTTTQPVIRENRDTGERELVMNALGAAAVLREVASRFQGLLDHQRQSQNRHQQGDVARPIRAAALPGPGGRLL